MSNVTKIESLFSSIELVPNTLGALGASIAWSFSMSLVNAYAAYQRLGDNDPEFARLNADQREDRTKKLERRIDELGDVVAWAASFANPDFAPNGKDVVATALGTARPNEKLPDLSELAALMGVDAERMEAGYRESQKQREESNALQRAAIERARESIERAVQQAIDADVDADFDISDRDAARICERIAEKLDQYEQNRVVQATRTRRARVIQQLGAERRLLEAAMNAADELAARFNDTVEHAMDRAPIEAAVAALVH